MPESVARAASRRAVVEQADDGASEVVAGRGADLQTGEPAFQVVKGDRTERAGAEGFREAGEAVCCIGQRGGSSVRALLLNEQFVDDFGDGFRAVTRDGVSDVERGGGFQRRAAFQDAEGALCIQTLVAGECDGL